MGNQTPKLIKRYANRKLYDTRRSCYVTLDEIAQMVKASEDVKIIDNKTKEDMTAVTLAQIIFEQEKKTSRMPLSVLRGMIQQSGEALSEFLQRNVASPVTSLRDEMERTFDKVIHRGDTPGEDGGELTEVQAAEEESKKNIVRELVSASTQALEDWQHRVDDQVQRVLAKMPHLPSMGSELQALRARVTELEKLVDEIEGR